jgi:endonuclease-3
MAIREKAKKLDAILKTLEKTYSKSVLSDESMTRLERFVFYLMFYSSPVTNARKALKTFEDETLFGDWNEVRVATQREIEDVLKESRIEDAEALAPRLKIFLQSVFEELDDTSLDPIFELKPDKAKKFVTLLEGLTGWQVTYLQTMLGYDSQVPWDAHTERVATRLRLFDPGLPLPQRKKLLRAALQDEDPLRLHHLFIEHGKKLCTVDDPKCAKCPINKDCDYYLRQSRKGSKKKSDGDGAEEAPENGGEAAKDRGTNGTKPKATKKK